MTAPLAHIVLVEPEIPNNTGNIGRTCVAMSCALHLVRPIGFDTDEKACRRAGLDYWPRLDLTEHAAFDDYDLARPPGTGAWYFSAHATRSFLDAPFARGDHLVFGRESVGLGRHILEANPDRCVSLPMTPGERSLNLSTAVGAAIITSVHILRARGERILRSDGALDTNKTRSC